MGFYGIYPLVMTNIAMVFLWPIEIDALPVNSMVIFHGYVKSPDGSSFGIIIYQSNTKYIYIHIYIYHCGSFGDFAASPPVPEIGE